MAYNRDSLPSCWQEFNHINRYWDKETQMSTAKILPGEFYVTPHNEAITTVLGSCISACVRDTRAGIGGMNHFMLPVNNDQKSQVDLSNAARYGNFAMEQMINDILRNGGNKKYIEIKICGGGRVMKGMTDVGKRNIEFARSYIEMEGYKLLSEDVGGQYPRKVIYFPKTGKARIKKLYDMHNSTIETRDENYAKQISQEEVTSGDIELF